MITLSNQAKAIRLAMVEDIEGQFVAVVTNRARLLIFPVSELPQLAKGKGNKLIQIATKDFIAGEEFVVGICAIKDNQKLRVQYGKNGKKHKNYSFEDLINFVSHRARKGLILPGIFNKADSIEVID